MDKIGGSLIGSENIFHILFLWGKIKYLKNNFDGERRENLI